MILVKQPVARNDDVSHPLPEIRLRCLSLEVESAFPPVHLSLALDGSAYVHSIGSTPSEFAARKIH
jgi:hypothetical protein